MAGTTGESRDALVAMLMTACPVSVEVAVEALEKSRWDVDEAAARLQQSEQSGDDRKVSSAHQKKKNPKNRKKHQSNSSKLVSRKNRGHDSDDDGAAQPEHLRPKVHSDENDISQYKQDELFDVELATEDSVDRRSAPRRPMRPLREPSQPGAVLVGGPDPSHPQPNDDFTVTGSSSIQDGVDETVPADLSEPVVAEAVDESLQQELERMRRERDNAAVAEVVEDPIDEVREAKPSIFYNRYFRLCSLLGITIFIGVVIGISIPLAKKLDDTVPKDPTDAPASATPAPTTPPTPVPTTLQERSCREQFVCEVGSQVNIDGTPHNRAANWIIFEDPLALPPDAPNLIQRYQLVLLCFLTTRNGEKPWSSCNPPTEGESDLCAYQEIEFNDAFVEFTAY